MKRVVHFGVECAKPICARCAGPIIQSGIRKVFALDPRNDPGKWGKSGLIAEQMFQEAKIEIIYYSVINND